MFKNLLNDALMYIAVWVAIFFVIFMAWLYIIPYGHPIRHHVSTILEAIELKLEDISETTNSTIQNVLN